MSSVINDLATLTIRQVIFHDVPHNPKGQTAPPILADDVTDLDPQRKGHLRNKLIQVLGSKHAYPIVFDIETRSPVPEQVRAFTLQDADVDQFVAMSQVLAKYLSELQHGAISSGLLCAMDVSCGGLAGIVLMKLEREEGAQLELTDHAGKKAFDLDMLDNLVLTRGTKLFKAALFLRTGSDDGDFRSTACDSQTRVTASDEMAVFWLRFLGAGFTVAPRIATQRFYDAALNFINTTVSNPVQKEELFEHLQSQIKSPQKTFSPKSFIHDYVPAKLKVEFTEHLKTANSLNTFRKDVSDIGSRLRTSAYLTAHGVRVSVPAENAEMVNVSADQIIVNDLLVSINRK